MKNYEIRLKLIIAKAQLILNEGGRPWHNELRNNLREIASEANKAYDEVADDGRWAASDR